METLLNILDGYDAQDECRLDVIHFGVGDISENDVNMAAAFGGRSDVLVPERPGAERRRFGNGSRFRFCSSGSVYGFNVAASRGVTQLAARRGVALRLHRVIYQLVEQLRHELSSKLPPQRRSSTVGESRSRTTAELGQTGLLEVLRTVPSVPSCQVRRRSSPSSTSLWGRRRFWWPAAGSRRASWTDG